VRERERFACRTVCIDKEKGKEGYREGEGQFGLRIGVKGTGREENNK
jgi:hypothetical protein